MSRRQYQQNARTYRSFFTAVAIAISATTCSQALVTPSRSKSVHLLSTTVQRAPWTILYSSSSSGSDSEQQKDVEKIERTTFDQAGASLIEEEDQKRLEQMGDFDTNPTYQQESIDKMREAVRARTAALGLEKSKLSAEYIRAQQQKAAAAGPRERESFAGLDLSKISDGSDVKRSSQWNEEMPTMFYDPEEELTQEEKEQADPIMKKNAIQQAMNELNNAKWPTFGAAMREVGLILLVIAFSCVLIIGWDKVLRGVYTSLGFIPTADDLRTYADRFSGLDLPEGWMNNMNEADVANIAEKLNQEVSTSGLPDLQ